MRVVRSIKSALGQLLVFRSRYLIILTLGYILAASIFMIVRGDWPTPDQFIIVGLLLAVLLGRPLAFLKDWLPFVAIFLAYEYLRGLAPSLGMSVHVTPLVQADTFLFGSLPTLTLQNLLYNPAHPEFYDYVFTLVYLIHFTLPLAFGLLLWVKDRRVFRKYMVAFGVLSIAGFLTYMLYPAMPPWMAAAQGIIPPVQDIMGRTIHLFVGGPGLLPTLYRFMAPNQVAAMPSLHAAYPALVYLFAVRVFGKKGHFFLLYALTVWIGVVYMAQHWVIDVLVGLVYAFLAFYGTELLWKRRKAKVAVARHSPPGKTVLVDPAAGVAAAEAPAIAPAVVGRRPGGGAG